MVKFTSTLNEDEVRSLFESIQAEPVRHSGTTCKVVTSMNILGDPETKNVRNKVTVTWSKGTGNIAIRTAAIIEDAALLYMQTLDSAYRSVLDDKDPETLEGMEDVMESLRNPAEHPYRGIPDQSDSDAWSCVSTKMPDDPEFKAAIENICDWGNQELAEYEDQRVRFIKMMVREFKAPSEFMLPRVDEGMEDEEYRQAAAAPSCASSGGRPRAAPGKN